jgi:hypothetical protein
MVWPKIVLHPAVAMLYFEEHGGVRPPLCLFVEDSPIAIATGFSKQNGAVEEINLSV